MTAVLVSDIIPCRHTLGAADPACGAVAVGTCSDILAVVVAPLSIFFEISLRGRTNRRLTKHEVLKSGAIATR